MQGTKMSPPQPEPYGDPARSSVDGFESAAQRMRRVLRTRPAESALHRVLAGSADLFRGDDYPQRLAEAAAGTQLPVTTGRRIAVVGTRGGAGKTTVSALLARIYAAMRTDTVAAVDLAPGAGTLGLRLGVPHAPPLETAAARLRTGTPDSLRGLAALLTAAEPANLLVTGRRRTLERAADGVPRPSAGTWTPAGPLVPPAWTPDGAAAPPGPGAAGEETGQDVPDGASRMSRVISRYCPITLFDCGPGLTDPAVLWAVANSHLAVFVTPASVAGLEDALEYSEAWRHSPGLSGVPLLVLVAQPAGDMLRASRETGRLLRAGVETVHLGHDRHLAAGVEVDPSLLSRRTRIEAVVVASRVLSAAAPTPGSRRPGEQPARRNVYP
ncbi:nucleotide-binding protein [Arthrobacter sp. Z1-15]